MNTIKKQSLVDWSIETTVGKVIGWIRKDKTGGYYLSFTIYGKEEKEFYLTFREAKSAAKTL